MVERCAWCSLISMHYFTHIYSASLLLGVDGRDLNMQPKQMHGLLSLALTDRECYWIHLQLLNLLYLCCFWRITLVCFFPHSEVVKICRHHGHGTVTH